MLDLSNTLTFSSAFKTSFPSLIVALIIVFRLRITLFTTYIEKKFQKGGYYDWKYLRYFLYEYEYSLWESTGVRKPSWELFSRNADEIITIEHILPQTPTKWYWRNQFRQFIQNESEMAALTGSLGNLLLLAQGINSSLQNDSFDEKKNPRKGSATKNRFRVFILHMPLYDLIKDEANYEKQKEIIQNKIIEGINMALACWKP